MTRSKLGKNKFLLAILGFVVTVSAFLGVMFVKGNAAEDAAGAPSIVVDYESYSAETVPNGFVGCAYDLFDAQAFDESGSVPVLKVSVYKNYSMPTVRYMITVEDGAFVPETAGYYSIEYKATNSFGKSTTVVVPVTVVKTGDEIALSAESIEGVKQGEAFTVPTATATGDPAFGKINVTAELYFGNKKVEDFTAENYVPQSSGEHTIKYTAKDRAGRTKVLEKTFTIEHNTEMVVYDDIRPLLPKYFVKGVSYKLPVLNVYEFTETERKETACAITVNGKAVTENTYVAEVTTNQEELTVKYSYKTYEEEYKIKGIIINTGKELVTENLFIYENISAEFNMDDELCLTVTENGKAHLVTPVAAEGLSANFSTAVLDQVITFRVVDSQNENQVLTISFKTQSVSVNGGTYRPIKAVFDGQQISFTFKGSSLSVGATSYNVATFLNGDQFTGFDSDIVYVSVEIEKAGLVKLYSINGTYISWGYDYGAPKIVFSETLNYTYHKDDFFTIPAVIASDLLDGIVECQVTLTYNDEKVSTTDGVVIDGLSGENSYQVQLTQYGNYLLNFFAKDSGGKKTNINLFIVVVDDVKPEIELGGKMPETAKVGQVVTLPYASATDNMGGEYNAYAIAINPLGNYTFLPDGTFTPNKAGEWTIRFYAYDEAGNLTYVDYTVTVTE